MKLKLALASLITLFTTAATLTVAHPALAASASCTVAYNTCQATINVAPNNIFHIATTGGPPRNWLLLVTDVNNGKVVVNELIHQNANVWRNYVYSTYRAEVLCQSPCQGLTMYFANY